MSCAKVGKRFCYFIFVLEQDVAPSVFSISDCCSHECLIHIPTEEKLMIRKDFEKLSFYNQAQHILQSFRTFIDNNSNSLLERLLAKRMDIAYGL